MTTLVRRAVLSLSMTRNRVVDKEMYLARLALDFKLFWDDNATIIPEFNLVDAERLVKPSAPVCTAGKSLMATLRIVQIQSAHYPQEYFEGNLLLRVNLTIWIPISGTISGTIYW